MTLLKSWSLFRLRSLLKDLHRIADSLDRLVVVAERAYPDRVTRRPSSVSASVFTMRDRAANAAAERTLKQRLGRHPTDAEVADLLDEARESLSSLR